MSLVPYLQIVARGKGRGRSLSVAEAEAAMQVILSGKASGEALGGFLMVLRYRGETAEEIAGFTAALRAHAPATPRPYDLDWPSYAAGRTRGAPLFLLAAKLVARDGLRVALHGWNSHQSDRASVRNALASLDIPVNDATAPLTYFPLEDLSPTALRLLQLRDTLGLRSCINTVLRMWNPTGATASVQGVFHPSYRDLQTRAGECLGQKSLTIIKGGGGEFERNPAKDIEVFGLRDGQPLQRTLPAALAQTRRLHDSDLAVDPTALWRGTVCDEFAEQVVIGTAALALWTLRALPDMDCATLRAEALWARRHTPERACA